MSLKSSCAVGFRENSIQKSMLKMTDFDPKSLPKMTPKSSCAGGIREKTAYEKRAKNRAKKEPIGA